MPRSAILDAQEALRQAFSSVAERRGLMDQQFQERMQRAVPKSDTTPTSVSDPGGSASANTPLGEATFNTQLQKFLAALGGRASVSSGKRSAARQQQLWAEALKKYGDPEIADNWVARPGTSNHERGLAADLKFADDKARAEAHRMAEQYGLYFPMGNEPWHVEPISTRKKRG